MHYFYIFLFVENALIYLTSLPLLLLLTAGYHLCRLMLLLHLICRLLQLCEKMSSKVDPYVEEGGKTGLEGKQSLQSKK